MRVPFAIVLLVLGLQQVQSQQCVPNFLETLADFKIGAEYPGRCDSWKCHPGIGDDYPGIGDDFSIYFDDSANKLCTDVFPNSVTRMGDMMDVCKSFCPPDALPFLLGHTVKTLSLNKITNLYWDLMAPKDDDGVKQQGWTPLDAKTKFGECRILGESLGRIESAVEDFLLQLIMLDYAKLTKEFAMAQTTSLLRTELNSANFNKLMTLENSGTERADLYREKMDEILNAGFAGSSAAFIQSRALQSQIDNVKAASERLSDAFENELDDYLNYTTQCNVLTPRGTGRHTQYDMDSTADSSSAYMLAMCRQEVRK
jgi:hypothetical protein